MKYHFDFPQTRYLFILFICFLFFGCSDEPNEKDWTILVYMAADNGLNNAALEDIEEMQSAMFSDDINVIVQIDHSQFNEIIGAYRYHIYPGEKKQIDYLGEIDSGDYNTLTAFANWGFNRYPSHKKALIIWSHGNGWYNAYNKFCPDNVSLSAISIPDGELKSALLQINSHLDLLILDACNMLNIEVVAEIYQEVDFVISSEASIPPDGFPYDELLTLWEEQTQIEPLVSEIVLQFINSYMPTGSQNPYSNQYELSCAAVRTAYFSELVSRIEYFSTKWQSLSGSPEFIAARDECSIEFNDLEADIDIKDYFTKLKSNTTSDSLLSFCNEILSNIENVFPDQYYIDLGDPGSYLYPAGTATIWFPESEETYNNIYSEYIKLSFSDTGWQNFLANTFE